MALKVLGRERLKKKFDYYPKEVRRGIVKAMEKGAEDIVQLAKYLAPKSGSTGALEESIGWTWGASPRGSMVLATATGKVTDGMLTITVYAGDDEAFYARWVEFGTAAHSIAKGGGTKAGIIAALGGGGKRHPGTPAHPFFYPAYRAKRKSVSSRIRSATTKAGRKAASAF